MQPEISKPHICALCSAPLPDNRPNRKYCSETCKNKRGREGYDRSRSLALPACTCQQCNTTFTPKASNRMKYCSRECFFVAIKVKSPTPPMISVIHLHTCRECGAPFVARRAKTGPCSIECRKAEMNRKSKERTDIEYASRPEVSRSCLECGAEFMVKISNGRQCFCSVKCSQKDFKRRRRLKVKHASWTDTPRMALIWDRDNGRCHICGLPCIRHAPASHPLKATLDHKWPISLKGCHSIANVGIAHSICNSIKGERHLSDEVRARCRTVIEATKA